MGSYDPPKIKKHANWNFNKINNKEATMRSISVSIEMDFFFRRRRLVFFSSCTQF